MDISDLQLSSGEYLFMIAVFDQWIMGAWLLFMEGSDDLDCVHSNYI
jgi:hypothetical protein